jgi:hypothetical protein
VSLEGKERGEPRRDRYPRISAMRHPVPLRLLQQTGGRFQFIPGSREPSQLVQTDAERPVTEEARLIAP